MKRILYLGILLSMISSFSIGQVYEGFNYQAVIRDGNGELITNQPINIKISVIDLTTDGEVLYTELHDATTTQFGIINLEIGSGTPELGNFSGINWSNSKKFLHVEADIGNDYVDMGTVQLFSVPFSMYANFSDSSKVAAMAHEATVAQSAYIADILGSGGVYSTNSDTLFVVKDHSGNVVFAVFPDGAQVIVNEASKGKVGGFAVSGRNPSKATDFEILKVTTDSTRVYINDTVSSKGKIGGFAVSGRNPSKAGSSVFFNISGTDSTGLEIINPSEPRMLWYPKSEAFLVGRVLIEHPDSVGVNSVATGFESKAIGNYSQAFGYQSVARSHYSTAIGKSAKAEGESSYAIGDNATTSALSSSSYALGSNAFARGANSYAIGNGAISKGNGSFAFGAGGRDSTGAVLSITTEAIAPNSFALGLGAKSSGINSFSIGTGTVTTSTGDNALAMGFETVASGRFAVALGFRNVSSGISSMTWGGVRSGTGDYTNTASGRASTAFGFRTTASGLSSTSWGSDTKASGWNATAWGSQTKASGYASTAWGRNSKALKDYNTAWLGGVALGYNTTAAGQGVVANAYRSFVIGQNNDTTYNHTDINYYDGVSPWSYISWYPDDPLFAVGNGPSGYPSYRSNAFTVLKDGTTIVGWDNTASGELSSNPDTSFVRSAKIPRDNGYLFYVHGKAGGATAWASPSDLRLKQNVQTIDHALNKVLNLRGVSYEWKDPKQKGKQIGFIAQEAKDIIPEVVHGSEETNYSMQYAPITAVLVEGMKEQQLQIEELKSENRTLKERLKKLEEIVLE